MRETRDVIIIGTGVAGLTAAIECAKAGLAPLVLSKSPDIAATNTNQAQGGIIAKPADDRPELLEQDILAAGCNYNSREAVHLLAHEGPALVHDFLIEEAGIAFSTGADGELDWTEEAAHSRRRILHYADHTGEAIQSSLIGYAKKLGVEIRANCTAVDLITNNHHSSDCQELYREREVLGVYALDNDTGVVCTLFAGAILLASGGIGNIYQYTTNPGEATGDGISMAHRAGADIINAEFVQFHPTALYNKDIRRFLISESLRGEGARLVDRKGRGFMHKYSEQGDLAPRDVVARGIFLEMAEQGVDWLYLDLAHHYTGNEPIPSRFAKIYQTCLEGGLDISKDPIPITPAAHYFCGGIKVSRDGETSLKRLWAAGECACTCVHGANRLASTSLLEGLLWGRRAAISIKNRFERPKAERLAAIPDWQAPVQPEVFEPTLIYQDMNLIKTTMWNHCGIIRTTRGLERAVADLNYHSHRVGKFYKEAALTRDIVELRNEAVTAELIVRAAMHNTQSIGCHYRA